MSIVVETGAVISGAESYISVIEASLYHSNRGNIAWSALVSDAVREQCLRKATDYMLQVYRPRWKGFRKDGTQTLDWPRTFVYLEPFVHGIVGTFPFLVPDTIVPIEVQRACAELALKAAAGELLADTAQQKTSTKVGDIEVAYDKYSPHSTQYRAIDAMLSMYLMESGIIHKVAR